MYIPSYFAETDVAKLHATIEQYSFATLVSQYDGEPFASHLPLLIDRDSGPAGTLLGHMARANPQWESAAGQNVLAIFSGPHAYISPQWYEAESVVPTWNYVAVHAYGRLELIEDPTEVERLLERMIALYETPQPRPWRLAEPPAFMEKMLRQIVAFRIPIAKLEGKWKLNQNRPAEQQQRVIAALAERAADNSRQIAELMQERTS